MRVATVLLAAIAAFALSLGGGFIYDDRPLLQERLAGGVSLGLLTESYWGEMHESGLYRPLSLLFLAAERQVFGPHSAPYRAVSLALHALCCWLVLRILTVLFGAGPGWAAALVFAAHPIHAEAVATVYGQADLLCAALALTAVDRYLAGQLPASLPAFFLSLCAKESAIALPALLLLRAESRRKAVFYAAPVAVYLALRWAALGRLLLPDESTITDGYSLAMRIKVVVVTVAHYLRLAVLPWGQTVSHTHLRDNLAAWPVNETLWLAAALAAGYVLAARLGRDAVHFGFIWFGLALIPVANLIPIGILVAERELYLPLMGVALLAGLALERWKTAVAAAVIAGVLLSGRVAMRWHDEETLWRTTVEDHPRSPQAQTALGMAILSSDNEPVTDTRRDEARARFAGALQLNAQSADARLGLGLTYILQGDCASAVPLVNRALELRPGDRKILATRERCYPPSSATTPGTAPAPPPVR